MNTELVEFVRNKKRQPIGVVVASPAIFDGKEQIGIGWSRCHSKKDKFNKEFGLRIARGRAKTGTDYDVPHDITPVYNKMIERSKRYFKKEVNPNFVD